VTVTPPLVDTPVVVIAFNRPDAARRLVEALRAVRPARVFVVTDGPRAHVPDDPRLCAETGAAIREGIDWTCDVAWNRAADNLGCRARVETGLDWVFSQVDSAIILEDDCIPDPSFFGYCAELLERYAADPRIGSVTGTNPLAGTGRVVPDPDGASYLVSRYPLSWGWATWRRAWTGHDRSLGEWPALRQGGWLAERVAGMAAIAYWRSVFDAAASGADAWDYGWTFAHWRRDMLAIHPVRNLVTNIGFDASATHTTAPGPFAAMPAASLPLPLAHPPAVSRDAVYDADLEAAMFSLGPRGMVERARLAITGRRA